MRSVTKVDEAKAPAGDRHGGGGGAGAGDGGGGVGGKVGSGADGGGVGGGVGGQAGGRTGGGGKGCGLQGGGEAGGASGGSCGGQRGGIDGGQCGGGDKGGGSGVESSTTSLRSQKPVPMTPNKIDALAKPLQHWRSRHPVIRFGRSLTRTRGSRREAVPSSSCSSRKRAGLARAAMHAEPPTSKTRTGASQKPKERSFGPFFGGRGRFSRLLGLLQVR